MDDIARDPHGDAPAPQADTDRLRRKGPIDDFGVEEFGGEAPYADEREQVLRSRLPKVLPLAPVAADEDDDADLLEGTLELADDTDLEAEVAAEVAVGAATAPAAPARGRVARSAPPADTGVEMDADLDPADADEREPQTSDTATSDTAASEAIASDPAAEPSPVDPQAELARDLAADLGGEADEPPTPGAVEPEIDAVVPTADAGEERVGASLAPSAPLDVTDEEITATAQPIDDPKKLQRVILGLLLTNREGLSPLRLAQVCDTTQDAVKAALERVQVDMAALGLPLELSLSGESFKLWTSPDVFPWLEKLRGIKKNERLSPAALETLAVIAYRQPVFRAEIEAIRGVKVGPMLRTLLDCKLVKVVGRADVPGRPLQYGTTQLFLERFGLSALTDLPSVKEFKGLQG